METPTKIRHLIRRIPSFFYNEFVEIIWIEKCRGDLLASSIKFFSVANVSSERHATGIVIIFFITIPSFVKSDFSLFVDLNFKARCK
jgi:hypothetical protein